MGWRRCVERDIDSSHLMMSLSSDHLFEYVTFAKKRQKIVAKSIIHHSWFSMILYFSIRTY